jgi:hypothetical protein
MTKGLAGLATLLALLLAAPAVVAHGAASGREIDTRLLADDEGAIAFGGCFDVEVTTQCAPGLESEGLDLVVLEVREASLQGEPAVIFRTIYQTDEAHEGRSIDLTFKAVGKDHTYSFTTDGASPPTGNFDSLAGPFDAFDGYPKAIDGYLKYTTLGVKSGDQITDIKVMSTFEGEPSDAMPGTWYASGEEMPYIPAPEGATEVPPPATYKLLGPAKLLEATNDYAAGKTNFTLTVKNPLSGLAQFVTMTAPGAITLDNANLNLEAGATRQVKVTITDSSAPAAINVTSDLDHFESIPLITAPASPGLMPSMMHNASGTQTGGHHQGNMTEDHDEEPSKGAPALPMAVLVVAMVAIALGRRT